MAPLGDGMGPRTVAFLNIDRRLALAQAIWRHPTPKSATQSVSSLRRALPNCPSLGFGSTTFHIEPRAAPQAGAEALAYRVSFKNSDGEARSHEVLVVRVGRDIFTLVTLLGSPADLVGPTRMALAKLAEFQRKYP